MPYLAPLSSKGYVRYATPGTFTWNVPLGVYYVDVRMMASGAGGNASKGGGGAAGLFMYRYPVTPGQQITIVVPAAGAIGADGAPATFGTVLWVQGGFADGSGGSRMGGPTIGQISYGSFQVVGASFFASGSSGSASGKGAAALANFPGYFLPGYGNGGGLNEPGQPGIVEVFW